MKPTGTMTGVAGILVGAIWLAVSMSAVVNQKPLWQGRQARANWVHPGSSGYVSAAAVHCGVPLLILGFGIRQVYIHRGG